MKIAITGKGGAGKTTIAAHLGKILSEMNAVGKILLIDADATKNLSAFLGYENITPVNKIKDITEKRARLENGLVNLNPNVSDLIDRFSVKISEKLYLLAIGGVEKAGMGCLCPENSILRAMLKEIVLKRNEISVIDMEAGLEIMSRGTVKGVDKILIICDPGYGSVSVTKDIIKFANELKIKADVIGNKIRNKDEEEYLSKNLNLKLFHAIPASEDVRDATIKGTLVSEGKFYESVKELAEKIIAEI
ncbi:Cobyrinic acid ac-diamide synthase [groundwater metagenome]|uniref:Cobyrinic acid ac-diamide synthase n=1 Tax=groundwater metagenome TaxID=717931 RepID=A0A098E6Y2_9ZZZZ